MLTHRRLGAVRAGRRSTTRRIPQAAAVSFLAATTVLPAAAACGADGAGTDRAGGQVMAAFYPMAWLAELIVNGRATVGVLTKPGTEPHDLELTPRQIADVGRAKLVIHVKGVQPAVDTAVEQRAKDRAFDAVSVVKTLQPPAGETGHEDEGEAGHEGAAELSYDPHVWLDPARMATIASALGERLATADPANAAAYRENTRSAVTLLNGLDGEFRTGLVGCQQRTIVTSHAAFGYLADRYRLKQVSIAGVDPQAEPSLGRLAQLTRDVKEAKVTTIFTETLVSPKVARTLATEAGVGTAVLDPVEGVAEGSKDDYVSIMRRNLQTLRTALKCP